MSRFAHSPASYSPIMFLSALHCTAEAKRYGDHASPDDRVVTNDLPYQTSHPVAIHRSTRFVFSRSLFFPLDTLPTSTINISYNRHNRRVTNIEPRVHRESLLFGSQFFLGQPIYEVDEWRQKPFKEHLSPSAHTSVVVLGEICIIQLECF